VPPPERPGRHHLTRADLPEEFTPDSLRHLGLRQLGQLRRPNHVLDPAEQAQFNAAFDALLVEVKSQLQDADGRVGRGGPRGLDPDMRRSYARTQRRLEEQARRARAALPQLDAPDGLGAPPSEEPSADEDTTDEDGADDVSADSLAEEIEESSTILELLDRIATIEEQSLEHQKSQLLLDTRGFFFAFLVSVSVIIAGVAPLVEAEPHARLLILMWTGLAIVLAGLVYAGVRATQRRK
jgi:hypothetical protein